MLVINDILDLSKLEQKKMPLEQLPFTLQLVMEESLEVVTFESDKKNLQLICDIDPTVPCQIIGDATRLRQILINLLSNSGEIDEATHTTH
jgi:signal transduction histidine kinase